MDVVAAAVPRRAGDHRVLLGLHLVAYAGEGVVLPLEAYHGLAFAPRGVYGGGHAGYAKLDLEAVSLKDLGYESAALGLDEAQLGVAPDLVRDLDELLTVFIYPFPCLFL